MEEILKTIPATLVKHFQSIGLTIERNFEVLPGKWADAFILDGVKLVD